MSHPTPSSIQVLSTLETSYLRRFEWSAHRTLFLSRPKTSALVSALITLPCVGIRAH